MATGIVAIAADQLDLDWLADVLYVDRRRRLRRARRAPRRAGRPLLAGRSPPTHDHAKGFAFLTTVAGTNVLGRRVGDHPRLVGPRLGACGGSASRSGRCFVYTTLIAVVVRRDKPGLERGINGTWFLLTVSTRSVAVARRAAAAPPPRATLLAFVALAAFTLGVVLYLIVMTMVFLRWTFQPLDPAEADPPAWIAAGAVAITVLAGSNLLLARQASPPDRPAGAVRRGRRRARLGDVDVLVPADGRHRRVAPPRAASTRCATTRRTGRWSSRSACTAPRRTACAPRIDLDPLAFLPPLTFGIALTSWIATTTGYLHSRTAGRHTDPS